MCLKIAYLVSLYPAMSHTFIEREVAALRQQELEIDTFSVRAPQKIDKLSLAHQQEARNTYVLYPDLKGLLFPYLWLLLSKPRAWYVLVKAIRVAPPGLQTMVRYFAYTLQAIKLAEELKRRQIKHIHVHMANNGAMVALLATLYDPTLSYSLTVHGSDEFYNIDYHRLDVKVQNALFVRVISHYTKAQVMCWSAPEHWNRYHIVHCGLDIQRFPFKPAAPTDKLRIITIGRLERLKGYDLIVEALTEVDSTLNWEWTIVGDGVHRPHLEKMTKPLGNRVHFVGAVGQDQLQNYLESADILIVSSFMEGVPVVLMEAMAKGVAVIATNVGGISELVEHLVNGYLVLPSSPTQIANAIQAVANPKLRHRLTLQGRRKVESEFNAHVVAQEVADLFRLYLTKPNSAPVPYQDTAQKEPLIVTSLSEHQILHL